MKYFISYKVFTSFVFLTCLGTLRQAFRETPKFLFHPGENHIPDQMAFYPGWRSLHPIIAVGIFKRHLALNNIHAGAIAVAFLRWNKMPFITINL
jgi:hypothetical protein